MDVSMNIYKPSFWSVDTNPFLLSEFVGSKQPELLAIPGTGRRPRWPRCLQLRSRALDWSLEASSPSAPVDGRGGDGLSVGACFVVRQCQTGEKMQCWENSRIGFVL